MLKATQMIKRAFSALLGAVARRKRKVAIDKQYEAVMRLEGWESKGVDVRETSSNWYVAVPMVAWREERRREKRNRRRNAGEKGEGGGERESTLRIRQQRQAIIKSGEAIIESGSVTR
ncbi:hypothetical protein M758_7G181100 [Ceratodon purpureus]|nr:hypothetical protein M758_7G181100 [Ceratodon purpureus]